MVDLTQLALGQVTVTFPNGNVENYNGTFVATPPADSDVDFGTLTGQVNAVNDVNPLATNSTTDSDYFETDAVADGKDAGSPVADAMTTEIFSVRPDDYVFEAIRVMGDKQVRRIPVVGEGGELAGIIAIADIALETEDQREVAETMEEISSGSGFWSKK